MTVPMHYVARYDILLEQPHFSPCQTGDSQRRLVYQPCHAGHNGST